MSEENKATSAASVNAEAEKDVQNVLAELKGEKTEEKKEGEAQKADGKDAANGAAAKDGGENKQQESSAQQQQGKRKNRGVKSDYSVLKESSDPNEIRKQVEFYFSDSNLPMDRFLLSKVGGSANNPVDLTLIHSFKRMRRFQPFSAIVEALKSSETLELTDNDTKVRRKKPLPESADKLLEDPSAIREFENESMARSIYAKGFGEEGPTTQFDIEAFFAQFGPTNAIRLRRTPDKTFKGSVFVEFDSEETQKKFLALDPKPKWKGQELIIKSKKEYCDEKAREIASGKIKNRGKGKGRQDQRDWRERRAEDQKNGFPEKQTTEEPSKKRAPEEGAESEPPAKKVDTKEG
ncbi:hypothetical protein VTN49DRAFT_846 [Thermomyces lanuginosus]|uniref:uncharacterized protein n=1 Tax=Thermomyces lanuginosus TaxID=5541 RepID=UPI003742EB2A